MPLFRFKKFIFPLLLCMFCAAYTVCAEDHGTIYLKQQKPIVAQNIKADDEGNIFCKTDDKDFIVPANETRYVVLEKPAGVTAAEQLLASGKYEQAAKHFKELANKYKYLGWGIYCNMNQAEALNNLGQSNAVIETVKPLLDTKPANPEQEEQYLMKAFRILAEVLIKQNNDTELMPVLNRLKAADDQELSAWAFNTAGQILIKQHKLKEAAYQFLQPVLLYDNKNKNRADSLFLLGSILSKSNDNRGKKYFELLKKDYPDSKLINDQQQQLE